MTRPLVDPRDDNTVNGRGHPVTNAALGHCFWNGARLVLLLMGMDVTAAMTVGAALVFFALFARRGARSVGSKLGQ